MAIFAIGAQFCWNSFVPEAECSWRHRLAECIPIDLYALFMLVLMQANIAASVACRWAFPRNGLKSRCKSINSIARNPCLNDLKEWKTKCTKIDANFIFMTRMRRQPYHTVDQITHTRIFISLRLHNISPLHLYFSCRISRIEASRISRIEELLQGNGVFRVLSFESPLNQSFTSV